MSTYKYVVNIVDRKTITVVKSYPTRDERSANKLERGASINLDHERYYTSITTIEEALS